MAEKKEIELIDDEKALENAKHAYELALSSTEPLTDEQIEKVKRLEFSAKTKKVLAQRVGYRCSCPECNNITIGPGDTSTSVVVLGEAAHIVGAVQKADGLSPRSDASMSEDEIKDLSNGIWLCRHHHKLVDSKISTYTVSILKDWKKQAEEKQVKLMEQKEPEFVEKYIRPQIHNDEKGINTQGFKDKEWCLLAYMIDSYNNPKLSRVFESDGDGHCFENDYKIWMNDNSIDWRKSQIRFDAFYKEKQSDIMEIVNNLTGLVKMDLYGLSDGKAFEDFCGMLFENDEEALEKIIKDLSKV